VEVVAGFLVVGIVVAVAAFVVVREAGRIARKPPPALFDLDDAFDWVVEHVPDDVAASLTPADVRRILTSTAKDLGPKGKDRDFGAGLVDAARAVAAAKAGPGL